MRDFEFHVAHVIIIPMIVYLSKAKKSNLVGVAVLRLDFNTEDDWRMKAAVPTIEYLMERSRAVVILSHKGRPLGAQKEFTLAPAARNLEAVLKKQVRFFGDFNFIEIKREIDSSAPKSIFVLENLRFMAGETDNDEHFAKNLASLGDFYVNDAFAVSHRKNASLVAITKFLPSYAGLIMESEIKNLTRAMKSSKNPLVMILGGAKANDKLEVVRHFKSKAESFLVGGVLASTLLHLRGIDVGSSVIEKNVDEGIKKLLNYKNIVLPVDFVRKGDKIYDIGHESQKLFSEKIKKAGTIIWSGPMGVIEEEEFCQGTNVLARAVVSNRGAFSVVGGGETVMVFKKLGLDKHVSFVSTGGGAMLEFLAGEKLPGVTALEQAVK